MITMEAKELASPAISYLKLKRLFDQEARLYTDARYPDGFAGSKKRCAVRFRAGLEHLYFIGDDYVAREVFVSQGWKDDIGDLDNSLRKLGPQIGELKAPSYSPGINPLQRAGVFFQSAMDFFQEVRLLTGKDQQQKARLLSLSNYKKDQMEKIIDLTSASPATFLNAGLFTATMVFSMAYASMHPFFSDISTNPQTQLGIALSYAGHYGAATLLGKQMLRMIKEVPTGADPADKSRFLKNVFSLSAFYLSDRRLSSKARDSLTILVPLIPFIIEEALFIPGLFVDKQIDVWGFTFHITPSVTAARNFGLGALNLAEAAALEWVIRSRKKKLCS